MNAQPVRRPTQAAPQQWSKEDLELAAARGQHQLIAQAHEAGQLANLLGQNDTDERNDQ